MIASRLARWCGLSFVRGRLVRMIHTRYCTLQFNSDAEALSPLSPPSPRSKPYLIQSHPASRCASSCTTHTRSRHPRPTRTITRTASKSSFACIYYRTNLVFIIQHPSLHSPPKPPPPLLTPRKRQSSPPGLKKKNNTK